MASLIWNVRWVAGTPSSRRLSEDRGHRFLKAKARYRFSSSDSSDSSSQDRRSSRSRHRSRLCRRLSTSPESDAFDLLTDRQRKRSPPMPKLESFDGKPNEWDSFIFHFRKIAHYHQWSESEKRNRLLTCLRGKAVTFIRGKSKKTYSTYRRLRDTLDARFGHLELPSTARRHLATIKQEEAESLEDFADRVLIKASEAYPYIPDEALQSIATESFLSVARIEQRPMQHQKRTRTQSTMRSQMCTSLWPICVFSGDRKFLCTKSLLQIRSQD